MRKTYILACLAMSIFFSSSIALVSSYDTILITTTTTNVTIDKGWVVTNTSDSPFLPEHQYTWNAQRNHLYNPTSLNPIEAWGGNSYFVNNLNQTVTIRDFYYTDIFFSYEFTRGNNISDDTFVYQYFGDTVPGMSMFMNGVGYLSIIAEYTTGLRPYDLHFNDDLTRGYSFLPAIAPNLVYTLTLRNNAWDFKIRALNASIYQIDVSPYSSMLIPEISLTGYVNTQFLNTSWLQQNVTVTVFPVAVLGGATRPARNVTYAENSNWWLPEANATMAADAVYNNGKLNVLGFDKNDITTLIKCEWINYQKPSSWEQRFSENLTVSRYSETKYFSEFPQIAYQSSNYPILDTYDRFNVSTNYYVAAWGILRYPLLYNKTGMYIMAADPDRLCFSIVWEVTNLLNVSLVINGVRLISAHLPVSDYTSNQFLESGLVIANGTIFGLLLSSTIIWLNVTGYILSPDVPTELQVYGNLFRGSEIREDIDVAAFMHDINPSGPSPAVFFTQLFANSFFLSTYQSVSLSLTYSFEIVSPSQDEAKYRNNWTFSPSDIYFRTGNSRGVFSATSSRTLLAILYLMRIMQSDTEYSRAELYNRTITHGGLAGKRASQSIRVDLALEYVMLTREYIVPLVLEFSITFEYIIYATTKPPTLMEFFLGAPMIAIIIPLILLIIFPLVFYDASGKNKIFAGVGLLVGIVVNAIVGLIDPVLSVLFAFGAIGIIYLLLQKNGRTL